MTGRRIYLKGTDSTDYVVTYASSRVVRRSSTTRAWCGSTGRQSSG